MKYSLEAPTNKQVVKYKRALELFFRVNKVGDDEFRRLNIHFGNMPNCAKMADGVYTPMAFWHRGYPVSAPYDTILVNVKQRPDHIMDTFFHELTHYRQTCQGRLSSINGKQYWNGKPSDCVVLTAADLTNFSKDRTKFQIYQNLPWEVEAQETATKMVALWKKENSWLGKIKNFLLTS